MAFGRPNELNFMMIRAKLDVTKIEKAHIHVGAKGKYIDITLLENRNGVDQYGNSGMVVQDIGKEAREAGQKGPILGNYKVIGEQSKPKQEAPAKPKSASGEPDGEDIPF